MLFTLNQWKYHVASIEGVTSVFIVTYTLAPKSATACVSTCNSATQSDNRQLRFEGAAPSPKPKNQPIQKIS